ncbi:MAG TPA: M20/M25/M40 family metallo-hydrolase [Bryobacteraceae bacterium]
MTTQRPARRIHSHSKAVFLLITALIVLQAAEEPEVRVKSLFESQKFRTATEFLRSDHARFVQELITLTEIPAPPFKEDARAKAYLDMLSAHGLSDVEMDAEGNVMGLRKGSGAGPMLAVLAHLDTVFPEGTDVKVKQNGTRLAAPGVGDDSRGLSVVLHILRAMAAAKFQTASDILFVGNVGEEGEGDLRGVKYLLTRGKYKDRVKQLIAVDGPEQVRIVTGGIGTKRYRVYFSGPGGHSYLAFGLVNPAFAMGNAITKMARLKVTAQPKTTFNVGVLSGGISANSIPVKVSMDVDLRSESKDELNKLANQFHSILHEAVVEENEARSTKEGAIVAEAKLISDRPAGETPHDSVLVRSAAAVIRAFGHEPVYGAISTDANIPMSIGIPAVAIARGGKGGRQHSLDEWVDVEENSSVEAAQVLMLTILAAASATVQ